MPVANSLSILIVAFQSPFGSVTIGTWKLTAGNFDELEKAMQDAREIASLYDSKVVASHVERITYQDAKHILGG